MILIRKEKKKQNETKNSMKQNYKKRNYTDFANEIIFNAIKKGRSLIVNHYVFAYKINTRHNMLVNNMYWYLIYVYVFTIGRAFGNLLGTEMGVKKEEEEDKK